MKDKSAFGHVRVFTRALILFLCACSAGGAAAAETTQSVEGHGNTQIGSHNEFVNTGEISVIIDSEASLVRNPNQKEVLKTLSELLSHLASEGEISASETAIRAIARNAVRSLAARDLTRNVISQRQFSIPFNHAYNIAGTRNRITYTKNNCGGNYGVAFTFNRESTCVLTGGTYTFTHEGQTYDLVFDGYTDDREAQFTLYPAE